MSEEAEAPEKGNLASASLVVAVAAVLLAGMILKTDGSARPQAEAAAALSLPLGETVIPEALPAAVAPELAPDTVPLLKDAPPIVVEVPTIDPVVTKLASRAESDVARLEKARGKWTAQLLVACKTETVARLLDSAHDSAKVYVLPAQVRDEACFRVCYGTYGTAKDASAADVPKSLRGKDKAAAVAIAKVLP